MERSGAAALKDLGDASASCEAIASAAACIPKELILRREGVVVDADLLNLLLRAGSGATLRYWRAEKRRPWSPDACPTLPAALR